MENKEVIARVLNLYPDVVEVLGTSDKVLDRVTDYIEKHKWLVNEKIPYTITLEQAFFSWYENVFFSQTHEMAKSNIFSVLSKHSTEDLFDMVSKEMFFLMESNRNAYYNEACYAVIKREAKSFLFRLFAKIKLRRMAKI
jgi:hypothetical protein